VSGALVPLVEAASLGDARSLDGPLGTWLFSNDPPPEASVFFGGFSSIECFTGCGVPEVERNLRRWLGDRARCHPFRPPRPIHAALHYLRCVGAEPAELPEPRLRLRPDLLERLFPRLPGAPDGSELLVIHPGSGGRAKRWSREGFVRIARSWSARGAGVVVVLGPAERSEADFWRARELSVLGDLRVEELASVLSRACLYLGNDSGPTHLAASVGAAGVALFGPSDERLWGPLSKRIEVVRPIPWSGVDESAPAEAVAQVEAALAEVRERRLDIPGSRQ
jgi:hypothetical protein